MEKQVAVYEKRAKARIKALGRLDSWAVYYGTATGYTGLQTLNRA